MIYPLCYFGSVMMFWGIPIALGANFWHMSILWGVIIAAVAIINAYKALHELVTGE